MGELNDLSDYSYSKGKGYCTELVLGITAGGMQSSFKLLRFVFVVHLPFP